MSWHRGPHRRGSSRQQGIINQYETAATGATANERTYEVPIKEERLSRKKSDTRSSRRARNQQQSESRSPSPERFSMPTKEGSTVSIYRGNIGNPKKLRALLDKPNIRDLPIFTLAVAGEYRTGKSFLLSYFLRYLQNQNAANWLGDEDEKLVGFDHQYGCESVTQGINIWHQPFIVKCRKNDGSVQKIVVLLMDSQGIFSAQEDKEASQILRIFALTTMISSVLVFNLMNQLNESVLSHLQLFTEYAKEATGRNETPFQKLMLLIRDWAKPDIKPFGSQGANEYFHKYFQGNKHFLSDTFGDIECYLMPRPGDCVERGTYNGCLRDLRSDFKHHLQNLTEDLLDPHHLVLNLKKELTGEVITAGDFCDYFENCCELLARVDWKQPHSMIKMHTSLKSNSAKRMALKVYKATMLKSIKESKSFMTEEQLNSNDDNARYEAKKIYKDKCAFAYKKDRDLYTEGLEDLCEDLTEEFNNYQQRWETERDYMIKHEQQKK
ncbi:unnamed protein product, partial [Meganyctiphanes norvegica]